MFQSLVLFIIFLTAALTTQARPEYASRHGINRCTVCHFSPVGGGLRNQYGKVYGAHGFKISKYASQELVSAELRFAHYNPKDRDNSKSGLFAMAGIVGASIPITPKDEATEIRMVYSHDLVNNFGWDSYIRVKRFEDTETSILPQYF